MTMGPIGYSSTNLNPLLAVQLRFWDAYQSMYGNVAYTDYQKFTFADNPAGDIIYGVYSEPLKPMPVWQGDRHSTAVDFRYWTLGVRNFGDSMELDVDDIKSDSGNPIKFQFYMNAAQRFAEAAVGLWPSMVAEAFVNATTKTWLPDGQNVFDLHPISPSSPNGTKFRNYYANSSQGGGAATPLTYANVLALLKLGAAFKAPNGLDYPIYYTHIVVPPGSAPTAWRLATYDGLPVGEIYGQAPASSNAGGTGPNEIAKTFGLKVAVLANMPAGMWGLVDASVPSELSIALKKRQEVTWQYVGPGGSSGPFPTGDDSGMVSQQVFETNKTKFGPKARGEAYFRNWWRVLLADGNATPVTSLSIVS
jgi:hypothetical protein